MQCRDWKTLRKSEVQSGYCEIKRGVLNYSNDEGSGNGFDWDGQYGRGIDVGCGNDWALHL